MIQFDSSKAGAHFSDRMRSIVRVLYESGQAQSLRWIADSTGVEYAHVKVYCRRMAASGLLDNPNRGIYEVAKGVSETADYYSLNPRGWHGRTADLAIPRDTP
jgi:predicted transcriptional regulator